MSADDPWKGAFRALVQDDNGRPLANLLREQLKKAEEDGVVPVPFEVVFHFADLLDPPLPTNPFKPLRAPPDQIQMVDGRPRLEAVVKYAAAFEAAKVERVRLADIHNEEAKKSRDKLEKWDITYTTSLEAFAAERGDAKAIAAFAKERAALAKSEAARAARRSTPVRLKVVEIPKARNPHFERNSRIVGEMLIAIKAGKTVSEAAQSVGEKQIPALSERQVTAIWAATKNAAQWKIKPKRRQRRRGWRLKSKRRLGCSAIDARVCLVRFMSMRTGANSCAPKYPRSRASRSHQEGDPRGLFSAKHDNDRTRA